MSNEQYIEELLYEIYNLGKSHELFKKMDEIRIENPKMSTFQIIELAYESITK